MSRDPEALRDAKNEKVNPSEYWTVLSSSNDWAVNAVSPDGFFGAYVKGDGCVHIWDYGHEKEDRTRPDPTQCENASYEHICFLDEQIARLIALRETAIRHFEQHGGPASREKWYYGKPMPIIDTMPPRSPEEQRAIFDSFEAERYQQRVAQAAKMGIAEEDIDQIAMSGTDGDAYFVQLRDGRKYTKPISEVEHEH